MTPLIALAVVLLLAWMVESLVEAVFGTPFDKIARLGPYKWLLMYIAFGVGILGAFVYGLDILFLLTKYLDPAGGSVTLTPTVFGMVLTGLAIGRGSNYIHDLMKQFRSAEASDTKEGIS
jgi:hypothetical protein